MNKMLRDTFGYGESKAGYDECYGLELELMCAVLKHMNASIVVKISDSMGSTDEKGKHHGIIQDVISGTVDIAMNLYFVRSYWKNQVYPFHMDRLKIISSKYLHSDQYLYVLNIKTLLLLMMMCWIFIISLKSVLQQSTSEAALNLLRMFVSASTLTQPKKLFKRLLFFIIMLAIFIASSFIESDLSASSIAPDSIPNIDSTRDLIRSNLTIYGHLSHKELILNEKIRKRYRAMNELEECLHRFSKEKYVACIESEFYLKFYIHENNTIHISQNHMAERYDTYTLAEDSPLLYQFNKIVLRLSEGGLVKLFDDRQERYLLLRNRDNDKFNSHFGVTIDELAIVFCIPVAGWLIAFWAFSIERVCKIIENPIAGSYSAKF